MSKFVGEAAVVDYSNKIIGDGIIENLNSNLGQFVGRRVFLICLSLAHKGLDGFPARIILFDILD